MTTVYEVTDNDNGITHAVKGEHMFIESGFLHIRDAQDNPVAIFARFDSVIAKPVEQE